MVAYRLKHLFGLIRFSHTVFALPFAMISALMAITMPLPDGTNITVLPRHWVAMLLCMVFARSAAMAFNRLVDQSIDAKNPRTARRHLPSGLLSRAEVWVFLIVCVIGFVASTALFLPNLVPIALSVPVIAFLFGYSFAKRFTALAHLWLGLALSLAPICVWVALRGLIGGGWFEDLTAPVILAASVATWVAGFDIIYACQDAEFDRQAGLFSTPAKLGVEKALRVASWLHAMTWGCLCFLPTAAPKLGLGWPYGISLSLIAGLLVYQHRIVRADDLERVNVAFFNVNAVISLLLLLATAIDCFA